MDLNLNCYKLFAGASWKFTESLYRYPASDYSLQIILKKGTDTAIILNGIASGNDFDFSKSKTETALLVNGDYDYQVVATNRTDESDVAVVDSDIVHIYPLLTSGADQRTKWQKRLDDLNAAYDSLCSGEADEVEIDKGKRIKYRDREKLIKEIRIAEIEVEREKGNGGPKNHFIRFIY